MKIFFLSNLSFCLWQQTHPIELIIVQNKEKVLKNKRTEEPLYIERELADQFKFSIYVWLKIAITGSFAPVRLAWVPLLRVQKNGFIYVEADTKNFMQDCSLMLWDLKFMNASDFKLYLCGASDH